MLIFEEYEQAVEVFSFVYHHPVTVDLARLEIDYNLNIARKHLDDEPFKAAWERGKTHKLKAVVEAAFAFWAG